MPEFPLVLRPRLRTRMIYLVLSVAVFGLCIGSAVSGALVGVVASVLFGFALVNALVRALHPLAYATRLDADGFEVFSWRGAPTRRVLWQQVAQLMVVEGNGLRGAGTEQFVAWRCEPRCPGRGWQRAQRGGRNAAGEEFDGALPDAYLGIEAMLRLFGQFAAG